MKSQSPLTGHMHSYNRLTVYSYEIGVLSQSPLTGHMHSYGWSHPVFTAGWVDNVSIPSNGSYAFLLIAELHHVGREQDIGLNPL